MTDSQLAVPEPVVYLHGDQCDLTYRRAGGNGTTVGFGEWGITLIDDGTFERWSGWFAEDRMVGFLRGTVCRFHGKALVPQPGSVGLFSLVGDSGWHLLSKSQVFGVIDRQPGGLFTGRGWLIVHDQSAIQRVAQVRGALP